MLAAGIVTISIDLGVTITDVALLSGYQLLVVGASGYVSIAGIIIILGLSFVRLQESLERDLSSCSPRLWD
jgi:hypothetical protein